LFFSIFGIKATDQTGEINITVDGKQVKVSDLETSKTGNENDILQNIQKDIQKQIPLYFSEDYFVSELKIAGGSVDITNRSDIKIEKAKKADIVLKKKLKVKEIKFKDSNFKQYLINNFYYEITKIIKENKDFTYKTIFDKIKKFPNLFKPDNFGIKLNDFEDTNETPYNGSDKLNGVDEITVILDEKKIEENAFSKFVFEYDEDIFDIASCERELNKNFKEGQTINEVFVNYLFNPKEESKDEKVEFDVFKNDDKTPIKCNSKDKITKDFGYFRVKLTKDIVRDFVIKKDFKVILSKKGCKIYNDDILKSIEETLNKKRDLKLDYLKESIFINEKIDKTMISIKNQDTSDTKIYTLDDPKLPRRVIIDLKPEAFNAAINLIFSLEDVQKDGRKLKTEFKNKFDKIVKFRYGGAQKSMFINQLKKIIPDITEGDIKLNGNALDENIKEGGVISIPAEKIPDSEFEPVSKPEEEQNQNTGDKGNSGNGDNSGDGDKNKKNGGCCGSNKQ